MKLKIKFNNFKLILIVPLSFLKSKFVLKRIGKFNKNTESYKNFIKIVPQLIKEIKKFKKKNKNFNLIEIYSPSENNKKLTITI